MKFFSCVATDTSDAKFNNRQLKKKTVHFACDFDRWYPKLQSFTFPSEILPISPKLAQAMISFYRLSLDDKQILTAKDIALLKQLEIDIEKIMQRLMASHSAGGIFVRMSNRSPKDGNPLLEENVLNGMPHYQQELAKQGGNDSNAKMIAYCSVQTSLLRCTTARQAMNLLLTSERVHIDLNLALDCMQASKADKWSTSIILREWNNKIRQEFEFRAFVNDGKLTAISQYNHYCKFDWSHINLEDIKTRIIAAFLKVHPHVGLNNYIIDFAVTADEVYVIELNPFDKTTGACMYNWQVDSDLLHGRTSSPETPLKIRTELLPDLDKLITSEVEPELSEMMKESLSYDVVLQNAASSVKSSRCNLL